MELFTLSSILLGFLSSKMIGISLIVGVIYFLPTIVAYGKKNTAAIFLLNLFLGWTFLGWVISLVWATSKDK